MDTSDCLPCPHCGKPLKYVYRLETMSALYYMPHLDDIRRAHYDTSIVGEDMKDEECDDTGEWKCDNCYKEIDMEVLFESVKTKDKEHHV